MRLCGSLWGGARLHTASLRSILVRDAVYVPFSDQIFLDRDPGWGIYTSDGHLVAQAAYVRGDDGTLVGQSSVRDVASLDLDEAPFHEMIYGGPLIPHYGHFLLTSLARLWACDGSLPVLLHSSPPVFDHRLPYIGELIAAAGFRPGNCASFTRPTRIRSLRIPEPAFVEQARTSPAYRRSLLELGERFPTTTRFERAQCYLSKHGLTDGVAGFGGEDVVEDAFSRVGFQIVRPETLKVSEQADLFRSSSIIAGTISSAFHSVALTPRTSGLRVAFNYLDVLNSNFPLIDLGVGGRSLYPSMREDVDDADRPNFLTYFQARNPEKLAEAMVSQVLTAASLAR